MLETVGYLGRSRKFDQVEAALVAYLRYHSNQAEPWMYSTLAIALEWNKRPPEKVKTALGYAAYLAQRNRSPEAMILVADLLMVRGYLEPFDVTIGGRKVPVGPGALLDLASELAPHIPAGPMMSVNLAQKRKDPKGMADALERLLSLGWPGLDEAIRAQARGAAETLAKTLKEDDRSSEAAALLDSLAASEGRDLFVRLSWTGEADIDLSVHEPLGAVASHQLKRTVFGGALIKEGFGSRHTEEVYVCPRGFDGDYTIRVNTIYNDPDKPVTEATVEVITHEGSPEEQKQTRTISLKKPAPIVVKLTGGRRKVVLPFVAPAAPAPSLVAKPSNTASPRPRKPADATNPAELLQPASSSTGASNDLGTAGGSQRSSDPKPIVVPSGPPPRRSGSRSPR